MRVPPGPRGREVFGFFGRGNAAGTIQFLERTARQYGAIASFRILHKRIYLVDDAELIREILVTRQHSFVRDTGAALLRELVGDGLITREEPQHRERRRILQPAFHHEQIASYAAIMSSESERIGREWESNAVLDIRKEMRRLTLSIVGASLFGTDFHDCANRVANVLERVGRRSTFLAPAFTLLEPFVLAYRHLFPRGRSLFFRSERQELEQVIAPVLEQRRGSKSKDVLSLLLNTRTETDAPLSREDVRNEIVTFVLAGHETTATALTWAWYLLANHPKVEERMHEELDAVLDGRPATLDDVPRLRYTAMVFQEAMRLYPPALAFARRPKENVELAGYKIRRGQSIFLSPYITQRNEKYFEQPGEFKPERWESMAAPKFAYFPFGAGAKMCIGEPFARMEGLLVLATLGRRWRLECIDESPVAPGIGMLLSPERPIVMRALARTGVKGISVRVG
jgi:cytochrome P450